VTPADKVKTPEGMAEVVAVLESMTPQRSNVDRRRHLFAHHYDASRVLISAALKVLSRMSAWATVSTCGP
jgi:hypothetical protein